MNYTGDPMNKRGKHAVLHNVFMRHAWYSSMLCPCKLLSYKWIRGSHKCLFWCVNLITATVHRLIIARCKHWRPKKESRAGINNHPTIYCGMQSLISACVACDKFLNYQAILWMKSIALIRALSLTLSCLRLGIKATSFLDLLKKTCMPPIQSNTRPSWRLIPWA